MKEIQKIYEEAPRLLSTTCKLALAGMHKLKLFLPFVFFLICGSGKAQNLVPNNSFEDTIDCTIWNPNMLPCLQWKKAGGTPDYFSNVWCPPFITMPTNAFGYQFAHFGNAYCGFMTFDGQAINRREYIQCFLNSALLSNNLYYVEFYVSVGDNEKFAVDRIGACFTDSAIKSNGYNVINRVPQIENDSGNVITDTLNWTKISGYFYAVGGEQYITIGNFRKDNKTIIDTLSGTELGAYYYIDDVSVIDCTATGINEQQQINFTLLQNPVTNRVGFTSPQQIQTATVFTTLCSIVKQVHFSNTINYSFDVADLPRGLYFLQVETKDKRKGIRRFVKQ